MSLNIQGLQKLTLLDYPGKVACTIFLGGCNFRCPFCHNASLLRDGGRPQKALSEEAVLAFLKKRQGLLDGVCITGGEPLLQNLTDFIKVIKNLGFALKLDTNGSRPEALQALLEAKLLDRVAMDVKNTMDRYPETVGLESVDLEAIQASIDLLLAADVEVEFRTTVCRELHPAEAIHAIGKKLEGAEAYVLQNYREGDDILVPGWTPYEEEELGRIARGIGPWVSLRGEGF